MKKIEGFTLIEILIVTILITIITALTQPNFSKTYNSLKLQSQIDELIDMLKLSMELSSVKQEKIIFSITENNEEIIILDKNMQHIKKIKNKLNLTYNESATVFDKGRVINENKISIESDNFYKEINITNENMKAL